MRHIRTVLGIILSTAELWGYIEDNPVRKTRLPRRRSPQVEKKVLSPEQLLVLVEALPEPSRSIVSLMVRTGLRIGEILALPGEMSTSKIESSPLKKRFTRDTSMNPRLEQVSVMSRCR